MRMSHYIYTRYTIVYLIIDVVWHPASILFYIVLLHTRASLCLYHN